MRAGQGATLILFNNHPDGRGASTFDLAGVTVHREDLHAWVEPTAP
jgi:hypothetical protein